ncbi:uncharacterized protein LOC105198989 [Solenopsis invicta]|uniref:uncharacterized protein LOC105198989 n=1 Tax=Solenopsis invicta TaxID=13686 RepID=UPI00193E0A68|nr:uncharacterized protein LOC105198989 [Solenopsis invicta]
MGSLPTSRVTVSRPFYHCGVDYVGPVILREGKRHNARNHKSYIAVFVYFATKAIHIELVSDLTTDAFLRAFKRFIARRSRPSNMYSDNGTTFVGAQRQLKEMYKFYLSQQTQADLERAHLTFEEISTVLYEIEAILNSRPITPLSEDPNNMSYIFLGHFLVGTTLNRLPQPDLTDVNENRLVRWQRVEQLRQNFWRRWSAEYLHSLQERNKWKSNKGIQLEPGQHVLIKQQNLAPLQWAIDRVQDVHPGPDNVARTATVHTFKGSFVRPFSRFAILI